MDHLVEAHYAMLEVVDHDVAGRVAYVDEEARPPSFMARARRIDVAWGERPGAHERAAARRNDEARRRWIEAREARRGDAIAEAERIAATLRDEGGVLTVRMESGVFEVVPDPFPAPKLAPARVLLVDDAPSSVDLLRSMASSGEIVLDVAKDRWAAIDRALHADFDVMLCAVRFDELSGRELYRTVARERSGMASRVVMIAAETTIAATPQSARSDRVLQRPLDVGAVRAAIARVRPRD
jgi:CheY-like chemotaxis protein